LEFFPEPVYPEFMPPEDEILPVEEQPLPAAVSPTADSPGYVPESDPESDLEENDDENPEEDPADEGDNGDDDEDEEAPSAKETKPFETDEFAATPPPHPAYHVTARISIRDETPISLPPREEVERLLAIPNPPSSPFSPWYEVRESSSATAARPTRGLRTDYGFATTIDREIMRDLERDVGYRITDTWDEMLVDMPGAQATDDTEMGQWMTEFTTRVRQDTDEIYTRLDDEQFEWQLMAGWLNMLYKDRRAHAHTAMLMEAEARITTGTDYKATSSRPQEAGGDYRDASGRSQEKEAAHRGTEAAEETSNSDDRVRETVGTRQRSCIAR
ncbi:hypothetical protein Tco_1529886, partial [Tanacetum coccineum]